MTNGEKMKQIFPGLQIDEGELEVYMWTTIHDAIDIPLDWWNAEYKEPNCSEIPTGSITKNCRSCKNFGSHHGICEICKDNKCWTEKEPIERYHSRNLKAYADDMGVSVEQAEKELLTEEPTTKNDLAVEKIVDVLGSYTDLDIPYKHKIAEDILNNLPSVTPQEPIDYKAQYERFSKKAEIVISQLRADRDRLLEALDKLRAEIDGLPCYFAIHIDKEKVLAIIDKYRAEIEPQEREA